MFTGVTKPISGYCAMVCRANSRVLIISAESLVFLIEINCNVYLTENPYCITKISQTKNCQAWVIFLAGF